MTPDFQYFKCGEFAHEFIAETVQVQFLCGLTSRDYPFERMFISFNPLSVQELGVDKFGLPGETNRKVFSAKVTRAAQHHLNCEVCPDCLAKRIEIMSHEEIATAQDQNRKRVLR